MNLTFVQHRAFHLVDGKVGPASFSTVIARATTWSAESKVQEARKCAHRARISPSQVGEGSHSRIADLTFAATGIAMVGELLGNYRLVAQIGSGSMGLVFLAQHQRIVRQVAIKVLAPELVRDQQALERFFNEARATSLLRHPGIVDIFDCDVNATGRAYIVLEHLEGETVSERLRRAKRLHWSAACLIARRVADALAAAHDKGIVHRDLKPDNLFLVGNGRDPAAAVKVLDFGVAKLLASEAVARLTMRGTLVGTPEYMSPEQCTGTEIDHRADVYSLGCILFEMVTGHPPFVTSSVGQLVLAHRFQPTPSAAVSCPDLPAWLDQLLQQMMAKDPQRRPQSMHEVSKALCRYKAQRWTHMTAGRRSTEHGEHRGPAPAQGRPRLALMRWLRRRRAEAMVVVAAMAVLAGAAWAIRRAEVVARPVGTPSAGEPTSATRRANKALDPSGRVLIPSPPAPQSVQLRSPGGAL